MSNPNPMNSRCGLEDCDCEYTIGGLLRRLEIVAEQCTAGVHPAVDKDEVFHTISHDAKAAVTRTRQEHGQPHYCPPYTESYCPCYQAGYEAERRPPYHPVACPCGHTQSMECDSSCLCYVAGSEEERLPPGR
jgi:hypothetical protein